MTSPSRRRRVLAVGLAALSLSLAAVGEADAARRGGGFGSRGSRTYQPSGGAFGGAFGAPVSRSMTPRTPANSGVRQPGFNGAQTQRPGGGFMRRWGGPLLGGLALGGLLGMMMGHGFGGGAGFLSLILQVGLAALAVMLVMRLLRRRREGAAMAGAPAGFGAPTGFGAGAPSAGSSFLGGGQPLGGAAPGGGFPGFGQAPQMGAGALSDGDELNLGRAELDAMERTFLEVQAAYGREDYAGIRERSTPEVMSFMAEELGRNASENRRNEMKDFRVLDRNLTEAWADDGADYATVGFRFANLDWTVDRASGALIEGDATRPTETTEFWTFARPHGGFGAGGWKVSAIQDAQRG